MKTTDLPDHRAARVGASCKKLDAVAERIGKMSDRFPGTDAELAQHLLDVMRLCERELAKRLKP